MRDMSVGDDSSSVNGGNSKGYAGYAGGAGGAGAGFYSPVSSANAKRRDNGYGVGGKSIADMKKTFFRKQD
jgi:hypothetical protein